MESIPLILRQIDAFQGAIVMIEKEWDQRRKCGIGSEVPGIIGAIPFSIGAVMAKSSIKSTQGARFHDGGSSSDPILDRHQRSGSYGRWRRAADGDRALPSWRPASQ